MANKTDLTAENLIKSRFKSYSKQLTDVRKKLEAIKKEKTGLIEYGKQLTGALNAMQDILKDTTDASIVLGGDRCTEAERSSA